MEFEKLQEAALEIKRVGDVGDLSKLIMAKNNQRNIPDLDAKLAHELADCLWSTIALADELNIDLEGAFVETMNALKVKFCCCSLGPAQVD